MTNETETTAERAAAMLPCHGRCDADKHSISCPAKYRPAVAAAIEAAVAREREFRGRLIEDIRELIGLVYENPKAGWGKTQDEMLSWIRRFIEEQHQRVSGREVTLQADVERLQADLATAQAHQFDMSSILPADPEHDDCVVMLRSGTAALDLHINQLRADLAAAEARATNGRVGLQLVEETAKNLLLCVNAVNHEIMRRLNAR